MGVIDVLTINMFSSADKVKGQGVGSVYLDLVKMLEENFPDTLEISINKMKKTQITHYHTVDLPFYFSTFFKKSRGRKIGYVHFVPETLEGSLDLPWIAKVVFYRYLVDFYKRMDHLVVVNPSFIPILMELGIKEEKITYIPNFVSKKMFYEYKDEKKASVKKAKGFKESDFIVFGAGQIQDRKGVDDFVELAKENPHMQFIWAGGFSFGKMSSGYEKYKEIYENPPENMTFTGIISREELVDYYNICDTFLLPSHNELFPMCILEAFNCGAVVMLRDLPLYQSIIDGDFLPAKDMQDMHKMLNDMTKNPELFDSYKKKSRKAAQKYSEENLSKIWYDFYLEQAAVEHRHFSVQSDD